MPLKGPGPGHGGTPTAFRFSSARMLGPTLLAGAATLASAAGSPDAAAPVSALSSSSTICAGIGPFKGMNKEIRDVFLIFFKIIPASTLNGKEEN